MANDSKVMVRLRMLGARAAGREADRFAGKLRGVDRQADKTGRSLKRIDGGRIQGAFSRIGRTAGRAGRGLFAMGRGATYAGVALGAGLLYQAKKGYEDLNRIERLSLQTANALRTTGAAAWISRGQIIGQAGALERLSGIEAETVQAGQNLLLTFTAIQNKAGRGNRIFDRTALAAVDMASAFTLAGKEMSAADAAIMLGKALNDPARGYSRLMRTGVSFSDQQVRRIKALQEEGDLLGAQKILLRELNKEFGNSASTFGRSRTGQIEKIKNEFGNIREAIVGASLPIVDDALDRGVPLARRFADRIGRVFGRRDLSYEQRVRLAWRGTKRDFRPLFKEIGGEIRKLDLGRKLADAAEEAMPRITDLIGRGALRAAKAFGSAWASAGIWGKLVTAAWLLKVTGGWRAFGPGARLASRLFGAHFKTGLGMLMPRIGRTAGRQAATSLAAGTVGNVGPEFRKGGKPLRRAGAVAGKSIGAGAARASVLGTVGGMFSGGAGSLGGAVRSKGARFRAVGRAGGKMLGVGLVAGTILALPALVPAIRDQLVDMFPGLGRYSGKRGWRNLAGDLSPLPSSPSDFTGSGDNSLSPQGVRDRDAKLRGYRLERERRARELERGRQVLGGDPLKPPPLVPRARAGSMRGRGRTLQPIVLQLNGRDLHRGVYEVERQREEAR